MNPKLILTFLLLTAICANAQFRSSSGTYPFQDSLNPGDVFVLGRPGDTNYNVAASNMLSMVSSVAGSTVAIPAAAQSLANGLPWSIAVIPDTQYLSSRPGGETAFNALASWLTNDTTRATYNLQAALHEGDIVENYGTVPGEWVIASNALTRIKTAGIPIILSQGNHDVDTAGAYGTTTYNTYFPQTWFHPSVIFKSPSSNVNHYILQTNSGVPWIFLTMQWAPQTDVVAWASNTIYAHSNHNAAIVTHAFCNSDSVLELSSSVYSQSGFASGTAVSGNTMWTNTFSNLRNIRMVLNGHFINSTAGAMLPPALANTIRLNAFGGPVYFMCFNYQNASSSGNQGDFNYVRMITFEPSSLRATVRTYNPSHSIWSTNLQDFFSLDWSKDYFPAEVPSTLRVVGNNDNPAKVILDNTLGNKTAMETGVKGTLEVRMGTSPSATPTGVDAMNPVVGVMTTNGVWASRTNVFVGPSNTIASGNFYYVANTNVAVTGLTDVQTNLFEKRTLVVKNNSGTTRTLAAMFSHNAGFVSATNAIEIPAGGFGKMEIDIQPGAFTNVTLFNQSYQGYNAPPFSPTNHSGYTPYTWFIAGEYNTNAGTAILPNRVASSGATLNLTNFSDVRFPLGTPNSLNGYTVMDWSGLGDGTGDWLRNTAYTASQYHEIIMVAKLYTASQPNAASSPVLVDNVSGNRQYAFLVSGSNLELSTVSSGLIAPADWCIYSFIWGTTSAIYTNGVLMNAGSAATVGISGLTLGVHNNLAENRFTKATIAEIITYTGATPGTNSTARAEIYNYLRTKYGL